MSSSGASAGADQAGAQPATIPVICGPTASGKSAIAMWLANRREVTIVSADSRQVYRGFDVGTAKPSAQDRARVPHCGIDVASPTERFSAAAWADLARGAVADAVGENRLPIIVGGTGFYISALFRPLWEQPEMDESRRIPLQRQLDALPTEELRRWCDALDPARAHLGRAQLLRAVEVALLTGEQLSHMHVARARAAPFQASYLLVDPGARLPARIAARTAAMFDAGWPDEVRELMRDVPSDAPAWNATGYDAVRALHRGELDREAAIDRVVIETRQYAKRQRTWFRHQLAGALVRRVDPEASGWQEIVDRWMIETEMAVRTSMDRSR